MDQAGFQSDEPVSSNRKCAGVSREAFHSEPLRTPTLYQLYSIFNGNVSGVAYSFQRDTLNDIFLTAEKSFPELISKCLGCWFSLRENDTSSHQGGS